MYKLFRNLMFQTNPEVAHNMTLTMMRKMPFVTGLFSHSPKPSKALSQIIWDIPFDHPVGLAAGLDKNGTAVEGLFRCGFAFVEVGTVTPRAQPGNPKPRMFRLIEDEAIINRMGFNNHGSEKMAEILHTTKRLGPIGINIGKNKTTQNDAATEDYLSCMSSLAHLADYIVINVSSPNTPGLRDLQSEVAIRPLVQSVIKKRDELSMVKNAGSTSPPVLIKLAPDLTDEALFSIGQALVQDGIDGFIASNTTIDRTNLKNIHRNETGGLSGRPLKTRSTNIIRILYQATNGKVPIIGSGGVFSAEDAYEKILAGASLIQIYTGFIYKGPDLIREIVEGLEVLLKRDGFSHIQEAVGKGTRKPSESFT